jgi:hypothetical protein
MHIDINHKAPKPDKRVDDLVKEKAKLWSELQRQSLTWNELDQRHTDLQSEIQRQAALYEDLRRRQQQQCEDLYRRQQQKLAEPVDLRPVTDQIQALWNIVEELQEKMNTREKQQADETLKSYWQEKHPDCFVEHDDGRKILSRDLVEWKHDLLLQELFSRKTEQPKKTAMWPLWVCIGLLFVMEMIHVF